MPKGVVLAVRNLFLHIPLFVPEGVTKFMPKDISNFFALRLPDLVHIIWLRVSITSVRDHDLSPSPLVVSDRVEVFLMKFAEWGRSFWSCSRVIL